MGSLALITAPTEEPITVAEARAQCRLEHTLHDADLADLIFKAREWGQGYTRRVFRTSTWDYYLDGFPSVIELPIGPVQSITSVKYYNASNVETTLAAASYDTNLKAKVARIAQASGYAWPETYDRYGAVVVRFIAGYQDGDPDLFDVRHALRLFVEAQYFRQGPDSDLMRSAENSIAGLRVARV